MSNNLIAFRQNALNTINDFGMNFTGVNYNIQLASSTEKNIVLPEFLPEGGGLTYTKPSYFVLIGIGSSTADVFGAINNTAELPTTSFALSESQMLRDGMGRFVFAGDTLSFISNGAILLSLSLYFKV